MHGLMNRAVQDFLTVTYGQGVWSEVRTAASLPEDGFEPLMTYEESLMTAMLDAASRRLGKPTESLLEDVGTFLVSHPRSERIRRLLRFGGAEFGDFLHSLDDLPARVALALPSFVLPRLTVRPSGEVGEGGYLVACHDGPHGFGHVLIGVLRAMADDYGALVLLEHHGLEGRPPAPTREIVGIQLLMSDYAAARSFELTLGAA
ncbi:MAG: heme NO-binding domain-containing protein [Hasllibacter sp.]